MPLITAWIDDLRAAFGREAIDAMISRGMKGEAGKFWASENGIEIGTRGPVRPSLTVDQYLKLGKLGVPEPRK